jgi:hypothetical protein
VNADGVAIERQNVVTSRWAIAEHEDLAPPFGPKVHEVVARATQKAGEIEITCFEGGLARLYRFICLSS